MSRRLAKFPIFSQFEKLEGRLLMCTGDPIDTPSAALMEQLIAMGATPEVTDEARRLNAARVAATEAGTYVAGDPAVEGEWSNVLDMAAVPIHVHLLPDGKVMYWDFSVVREWDPATGDITLLDAPGYQVFCSGHSYLSDGRLFVSGGNQGNNDGVINASIYDPVNDEWTAAPNMNNKRWYPTNTTLGSGDVLTVAGQYKNAAGTGNIQNTIPQVYDPDSNTWRTLTDANLSIPLYPYMYQAPDGRAFLAGPSQATRYLDTAGTGDWETLAQSGYGFRDYGSSVMYGDGKILITGGSHNYTDPVTNECEVIDLNDATPTWTPVGSMQYARKQHNSTILPDGTVLMTGGTGAIGFSNVTGAVFNAEVWNPDTGQFTTLAAAQVPRLYHSTALLLPDGRVLVAGGGHPSDSANGEVNHPNAEVYSPPYLFKGDRPIVNSAPETIGYGAQFDIGTSDPSKISDVTLVRLGSVTHSFNMNQRIEHVNFSRTEDGLRLNAPTDANLVPPGHYMLFTLSDEGVPSVAKIVQILPDVAPTVAALSDSPDPVALGNPITLTATGVIDADGISRVDFFRESNNIAGLQDDDTFLGSDNNAAGGYTLNVSTTTLAEQAYTYYARAVDMLFVASSAQVTTNTPTGASISGTIFNDVNSNGVRNAGEEALSNWQVYLDSNCNNIKDAGESSVSTNANGEYKFSGMQAGTYRVRELIQTEFRRSLPISPGYFDQTIAAGESVGGKDFGNTTKILLNGKVFEDANGNSLFDAGESSFPSATVNVISNNLIVATRTTDANGMWQVKGLSAGTGAVQISVPAGFTVTAPIGGAYTGTVSAGTIVPNINFGLQLIPLAPSTNLRTSILASASARLDFFAD